MEDGTGGHTGRKQGKRRLGRFAVPSAPMSAANRDMQSIVTSAKSEPQEGVKCGSKVSLVD